MKFTFFSDPGHGWVKVPLALIKELGIARDITQYSYIKGDWVYLEEDCEIFEICGGVIHEQQTQN